MQRIKDLIAGEEPLRWLFYGDSITHGAAHTQGWRDYTQHFNEWIRYEKNRGLDLVLNTAISGHTTRPLLEQFEWRAAQFRPHVAFIMIGMNDCEISRQLSLEEFEANLHELGDRFTALGTIPVMQTTCPIILPIAEIRSRLSQYMEVIRKVADARDFPLVDHYAHWEKAIAASNLRSFSWMGDAIHPNAAGHRAFAQLLINECGGLDPTSRLANVLTYKE